MPTPSEINVNKTAPLLQSQANRESNARTYPRSFPLAIQKAQGIYITDVDGKSYIDCLAGAGTLALGHNHPVVIESIKSTIEKQIPLHTLDLTTPLKEAFINELFDSLPQDFANNARIHFCGPTGADGVEAAIKLAKIATGKSTVFAFHGGYHGSTHATMSLSGNLHQKAALSGLIPNVHFLPYPFPYRCPFGGNGDQVHKLSSRYLEGILNDPESGILPAAGLIVEPVQGEGGAIPAPVEWLQEIRRITKTHDIPLIIDEVQTGFGRTGKLFAFEHAGITPDILVLSKAIGGGLPLSVIIYHKKFDHWMQGAHIGTFRGNQLAMAAGLASLKFIRNQNIPQQASIRGQQLRKKLHALRNEFAEVGDVRGLGLMLGVEIIQGQGKVNVLNQPLENPKLTARIQRHCFNKGLILEVGGRHSSVLRFLPPLIVSSEQIETISKIFRAAINETCSRCPVSVAG